MRNWQRRDSKLQLQRPLDMHRRIPWPLLGGILFSLLLVSLGAYFFSGDDKPPVVAEVKAEAQAQTPPSVPSDPPPATETLNVEVVAPPISGQIPPKELDKKQLAEMIGPRPLKSNEVYAFPIHDEEGQELWVQTTMDPVLQKWATEMMTKVKAKSAALVAIEPTSGEVKALASYRDDGRPVNAALSNAFPAASLIKIVTAAAALEKKDMTGQTTLAYDGPKYKLYRENFKKGVDQGQHQVTLKKSFAQSLNPVFGKIGAFSLGPKALTSFAEKFYFNQPIEFEMPVEESQFLGAPADDVEKVAKLASGLEKSTKTSPLHSAMLASAIVNDGELMEPTVVREVFDMDNRIYYKHEPRLLGQVVSTDTVKEIRKLMRATITEGTGRRRFRDINTHQVLSRLEIGGKSGTLNNEEGFLTDWFICFAKIKKSHQAVAMAVVVVHDPKHYGVKSQDIIREAIIQYFRPLLFAKES